MRVVRKADDYLADLGRPLASAEDPKGPLNDARREFALWEDAATGEYLTGDLSAVDLDGLSVRGPLPAARRS